MRKLKCVIVEDEPIALGLVKGYVLKTEELELLNSFTDPIKALDYLSTAKVDLAFLDINMPDMTGMELSKYLSGSTRVIFTTAYEDYALESYKVKALDYLLKPFSYEEFYSAVQKAIQYYTLLENQKEEEQYLQVRAEHKVYKIGLSTIMFVENVKNYVVFRLSDGSKVMALMSLKSLLEELPENFMKVHRSFIINLDYIGQTEAGKVFIGEHEIPISDSHKKAFKTRMLDGSIN